MLIVLKLLRIVGNYSINIILTDSTYNFLELLYIYQKQSTIIFADIMKSIKDNPDKEMHSIFSCTKINLFQVIVAVGFSRCVCRCEFLREVISNVKYLIIFMEV